MFKNFKSKEFFSSMVFKAIFAIIVAVIIFLLAFKLGELVGFKKAESSFKWGNNYFKNFAGPRQDYSMMTGNKNNFVPAHGIFGTVIKVENSSSTPDIIVRDQNNQEKIIIIEKATIIERIHDIININDIKVDDSVVIIGSPDDSGQIKARLIRVMPSGALLMPGMQGRNLLQS